MDEQAEWVAGFGTEAKDNDSNEELLEALAQERARHGTVLGRYVGLLKAREDVVPEMVGGATLEEVDASLAQSRAAFERLAERLKVGTVTKAQSALEDSGSVAESNSSTVVPSVAKRSIPAGGSARRGSEEILAEAGRKMSPLEKIRLGLGGSYLWCQGTEPFPTR